MNFVSKQRPSLTDLVSRSVVIYALFLVPSYYYIILKEIIFWHVDPLLGNDPEMSNYTTAVAKEWPLNSNRRMVFSARPVPMVVHVTMKDFMPPLSNNCTANRGTVFFYAVRAEMLYAKDLMRSKSVSQWSES
jgi:hypothetical protein